MAIGSNNNREIQFKKRGDDNKLKVLIYGRDGSGKSTYAEQYCKENGLNAVVIDIEDTNYTDMIMVNDIDLSDDVKAFRNLKRILSSIPAEFDTIIIDGIDSVLEAFVSNAGGMKCFADRAKTFTRFLRECVKTDKHLIFIGQSPVDLDNYTGDEQPNKSIVKLNAFVNEKYRCTDNYKVETTKYRGRK